MIFRHLLNMRSHPTWVRGLKQHALALSDYALQSHPTWVRGLKQGGMNIGAGALGRTLRGCVD